MAFLQCLQVHRIQLFGGQELEEDGISQIYTKDGEVPEEREKRIFRFARLYY